MLCASTHGSCAVYHPLVGVLHPLLHLDSIQTRRYTRNKALGGALHLQQALMLLLLVVIAYSRRRKVQISTLDCRNPTTPTQLLQDLQARTRQQHLGRKVLQPHCRIDGTGVCVDGRRVKVVRWEGVGLQNMAVVRPVGRKLRRPSLQTVVQVRDLKIQLFKFEIASQARLF